jgi:hypothetical protein
MFTPAQRLYFLFLFVLVLILFVLAAYTVWIDPSVEYGFWSGIKHGFFAVQNGIIGLFTGREFYAPQHTNGYRWGYWAGLFLIPGLLRIGFEVLEVLVVEWLRR